VAELDVSKGVVLINLANPQNQIKKFTMLSFNIDHPQFLGLTIPNPQFRD
jgi:hypothetical protein